MSADDYLKNRIGGEKWEEASEETKKAAINTAKNIIDSLSVSYRFSHKERSIAVYEQAYFLIQMNKDDYQREQLKNMGVTFVQVPGMGSESINQNIPLCSYVRSLIKKYQFRPGKIK